MMFYIVSIATKQREKSHAADCIKEAIYLTSQVSMAFIGLCVSEQNCWLKGFVIERRQ
jgi:hypothetical protein